MSIVRNSEEERAAREREAYNEGLKRRGYNDLFSHSHHYADLRMRERAQAALAAKAGGKVLELGSKSWALWIDPKAAPGELHCVNVSERELDEGRELVAGSSLRPIFHLMDAHKLDFPDHSFDAVFGAGILHHLNLESALKEIVRVVKPDGLVVFGEPMDLNPVGWAVRKMTPRARTSDERPFRVKDLRAIRQALDADFLYEQLFSVPVGVLSRAMLPKPDNIMMRATMRVDDLILKAMPFIGPLYRVVLIIGRPRKPLTPNGEPQSYR
jgi:SAM-dependent methyltransferase